MLRVLSQKIRIEANNKFKTYCRKAFGCSRLAYNWGLAEYKKELKKYRKAMSLYRKEMKQYNESPLQFSEFPVKPKLPTVLDLKKRFNSIKAKECPYMYEVTKYASQQTFIFLGKALTRYYEAKKNKTGPKVGFPVFKKRSETSGSFYLGGDQVELQRFKTCSGAEKKSGKLFLRIPNFGWVKLTEEIRFSGHINNVTISQDGDEFFASFSINVQEAAIEKKTAPENTAVGIDLGLDAALTLSDGIKIYAPKPLKRYINKIKALQRRLSKKQHPKTKDDETKYSRSYFRLLKKIKKLYTKISHLRKDFIDKTASFIARNYSYVALENLNVKGMMSNHRLARALADVSFGRLKTAIVNKVQLNDGKIIEADRFYPSSKRCCKCGEVKKDLKLSDRIYKCENCGNEIDRDLQASVNLLNLIKKSGVASAVRSLELRSILADLNKNQLANLVMKA